MSRLLLTAAALCALAAPGFAQSTIQADETHRIDKLERDIDTLYRAVFQKDPNAPASLAPAGAPTGGGPAVAQMAMQIQAMEGQIRTLTGQVEAQAHAIEQLRLQVSGTPIPVAQAGPAPRTEVVAYSARTEPEAAYEAAFAVLKDGRYPEAEQAFAAFLERWPTDPLAANAQYWLAESLYARGEYDAAARGFAQGYKSWPHAPKAPDNLLKLALSLDATGQRAQACTALERLQADYPQGAAPVLRRAREEGARLGCGG